MFVAISFDELQYAQKSTSFQTESLKPEDQFFQIQNHLKGFQNFIIDFSKSGTF